MDGYYAHAQASNAYNFCLSWNATKFIRTFMGQYLKGNNMAPIKIIMADVMHMRKFIMLITSVFELKISTKFTRMFMGQYLKGNNMRPQKKS